MADIFDQFDAAAAQKKYCEREQLPMFAPRNGYCSSCAGNIYVPMRWRGGSVTGYTVEYAGSRLITRCPHCSRSFTG